MDYENYDDKESIEVERGVKDDPEVSYEKES